MHKLKAKDNNYFIVPVWRLAGLFPSTFYIFLAAGGPFCLFIRKTSAQSSCLPVFFRSRDSVQGLVVLVLAAVYPCVGALTPCLPSPIIPDI